MKYKYVECDCHSVDHLTRICFDEEDCTFYLEFKVVSFPTGDEKKRWWKVNTLSEKIAYKWHCVKTYFKNVWWSIKGVPSWYGACADLNPKESTEMIVWMKKCLEDRRKKYEKKK